MISIWNEAGYVWVSQCLDELPRPFACSWPWALLTFYYAGLSRDYSIGDRDAWRIAQKLEFIAGDPNGPISELCFAPSDICYKNGQHLKSNATRGRTQFTKTESPFTRGDGGHQDHCHVALKPFRRLFWKYIQCATHRVSPCVLYHSQSGRPGLSVSHWVSVGTPRALMFLPF